MLLGHGYPVCDLHPQTAMNQDALRQALMALQARQRIGEDVLCHHLNNAQKPKAANRRSPDPNR